MIKLYLVGGTIRDKLMGLPHSNDLDFAVEAKSFAEMKEYLVENYGLHPWLEREQFGTIRGNVDKNKLAAFHLYLPDTNNGRINADFTLCRKDGFYSDSRHPDSIEPATIYGDLARRDFTINALAVDEDRK